MANPLPEHICQCKCGYISVKFNNGAWNTLTMKTYLKRVGPSPVDIEIEKTWACDGCGNHWTVENKSFTLFKKKPSVTWTS